MSGIFPNEQDGGRAPEQVVPSGYAPNNNPIGTVARYYGSDCGITLRPEVLNAIISELVETMDRSGTAYNAGTRDNLSTAILRHIQQNASSYGVLAGGPSNFTAALTPNPIGYTAGMLIWLHIPAGISNGGAVTINVNGLGARPLVKQGGGALEAGDLQPDSMLPVVFANGQFYSGIPLLSDYDTSQFITDAPADGLIYGRQNNAWTPINTGGAPRDIIAFVTPGGVARGFASVQSAGPVGARTLTCTFSTPQPDANYFPIVWVQSMVNGGWTSADGSSSAQIPTMSIMPDSAFNKHPSWFSFQLSGSILLNVPTFAFMQVLR